MSSTILERTYNMKKLFCIILALISALTFSGCGKNNEPPDISKIPQIMMFEMYKNQAWGESYKLNVYTKDGGVCSLYFFREQDNTEPTPDWASAVDSEDWYERLSEIAESAEEKSELSEDKLNLALSNALNFGKGNDMPFKDNGVTAYDAGRNDFYGVYYDENGTPQKTLIAYYGDYSGCRKNGGARKFVNDFLNLTDSVFKFK